MKWDEKQFAERNFRRSCDAGREHEIIDIETNTRVQKDGHRTDNNVTKKNTVDDCNCEDGVINIEIWIKLLLSGPTIRGNYSVIRLLTAHDLRRTQKT